MESMKNERIRNLEQELAHEMKQVLLRDMPEIIRQNLYSHSVFQAFFEQHPDMKYKIGYIQLNACEEYNDMHNEWTISGVQFYDYDFQPLNFDRNNKEYYFSRVRRWDGQGYKTWLEEEVYNAQQELCEYAQLIHDYCNGEFFDMREVKEEVL